MGDPDVLDYLLKEKVNELKRLIKPGVPTPKPQKARTNRAQILSQRKGQFKMMAKQSLMNLEKFEAKLVQSPAQKASAQQII
jgi:hypothetical protein